MEVLLAGKIGNSLAEVESKALPIVVPNTPIKKTRFDVPHNRIIKRTVDILLGGTIALLLLPWLVPLVALFIKIDSKGPVFFLQKRTGLNRKNFYCIKFRSMVVNDEAHRLQVQVDDKRITRVGYYLRKYFIDETPQLINVLMGEMSLVGPRPHMLRHNVIYSRIIRDYHDRHRVKPGLTGLAQMRGYHGIIQNKQDLVNLVTSDLEYIEKWSLFRDLYIFFRTIFHILLRH